MAGERRERAPEYCPVCGEPVPRGALACPECGADHASGWRVDAAEAELPDESFDYDEFVRREFVGGDERPAVGWLWWATAAALVLALLALWVGGVFVRGGAR